MKKFLLSLLGVITCICAQATDYQLVTSESDLKEGANYIIVATSSSKWYAMGIYANGNNFPNVTISAPTNNIVKINTEQVSVISLESSKSSSYPYQLNAGEKGYLYAAGTGKKNNYLKATTDTEKLSETAQATITIAETGSAATIKFNNSSAPNSLRFNSSAKLFSCYSTTQTDIYLYKEVTTPGGGEGTKAEAGLAYTPTEVTLVEGETLTQPTLNYPNELAVTYSTNNAEVATVNATTGEIALAGGLGTAVITATSEETETYKAGSATVTITVKKAAPVYVFADTKATLVTDATTLKAGDVIVIAAYGTTSSKDATWNCAMSTSSEKSDYRGVTDVTFNGNHSEITSIPNDVMLIKLEQTQYNETDYWLFKTLNYTGDNGYLGNTAISSNNMSVVPDGNTNTLCYAKIESNDDNTVKVLFNLGTKPSNSNKNGASYNRNYLQYNQGFPRFACYGQEQTNGQVYIYKLETPTTIVGEDLTEVTMNEGHGPNTLNGMSIFSTNSTATEFVVKMNGVAITSAEVAKVDNTITVNLSGLPYLPGAEFTIAPVVNRVEGHSEALGIQMPALPTFTVADSRTSLTYDGKEAETGTCNIDAVVKLYITSTAGEGAKPFNYYFEIENKSGFENAAWDWLNDDKGYGITYIVKNYLRNVTTQKQGEGENAIWTPVLPTDANLYTTLKFDVKPYFAFYVTPELASLITEATPAPMAAPARAGEGFVLQNVYSTQVFDQQFNFSATTDVSGVEGVTVDGGAAVEYFNLQGVRVDGDLAPGIYIRRQGQSVSKVRIN